MFDDSKRLDIANSVYAKIESMHRISDSTALKMVQMMTELGSINFEAVKDSASKFLTIEIDENGRKTTIEQSMLDSGKPELREMVDRIKRVIVVCDAAEKFVRDSIAMSETLTQSFRGSVSPDVRDAASELDRAVGQLKALRSGLYKSESPSSSRH